MSASDLLVLLLLVAFGILVGCIGGVIAAKRGNELSVTIVPTALWSTGLLLGFLFIWGAADAIFKQGFGLGSALLLGIGYVFNLGLWAPIVTAFPTAFSTIIAYLVTQTCRRRRFAEQAGTSTDG
jgi:hypothetical protein